MKRLGGLSILLVATFPFRKCLILLWRILGFRSPLFVLIAMIALPGLVVFVQPVLPLRLPSFLRELRDWEMRGRLYRRLGVPAFGALLRMTPLRYLNPRVYLHRTPGNPASVEAEIEVAEAAHFWATALIVPYMVYVCVRNWWGVMLWSLVVRCYWQLHCAL